MQGNILLLSELRFGRGDRSYKHFAPNGANPLECFAF